jgi:hypothetical protein
MPENPILTAIGIGIAIAGVGAGGYLIYRVYQDALNDLDDGDDGNVDGTCGGSDPPAVRGTNIVNRVNLLTLGFAFGDGDKVCYRDIQRRIEGANRTTAGRLQIFWTSGIMDDGFFRHDAIVAPTSDPDGLLWKDEQNNDFIRLL